MLLRRDGRHLFKTNISQVAQEAWLNTLAVCSLSVFLLDKDIQARLGFLRVRRLPLDFGETKDAFRLVSAAAHATA